MTVLIAYATIEGQTGKIARFIADELRKAGADAVIVDLSDQTQTVSLGGVDKVILAGSVHERRHPKDLEIFLAARRDELMAKPTLLISVSLNAAFPEGLEEAQDYLVEMEMRTGFTPTEEALVAGAIRTTKYDYFASQVIRYVVMRGRDYDASASEHEFTDWEALRATVLAFLEKG